MRRIGTFVYLQLIIKMNKSIVKLPFEISMRKSNPGFQNTCIFPIIFFVLFFSFDAFSQIELNKNSKKVIDAPNCFNRYNIDYKLENYTFNGDSTILTQIDLESIESQRSTLHDVTVLDPINNVSIVLFKKEAILIIEK
jgi:hypothetical protein